MAYDCLVRTRLIEQMKASTHQRPKPKRDFQSRAKELFKIGKLGFERAWARAIEDTSSNWNKPGPTAKKSIF